MPITSTSAPAAPAASAAATVTPRTQPVPVHRTCDAGSNGVRGPAEHATRLSAPAAAQARHLFPQVRVPQVRQAAVHRLRQRARGIVRVRKDRVNLGEQKGKVLEKVARLRRRRLAAKYVAHEL
jgi:hypothetical protein